MAYRERYVQGGLNDRELSEAVRRPSEQRGARYSTPEPDGDEYIAVCLAAFSMETVHRDA